MKFSYPEGATPIDDISGLKPAWVKTQEDLNQVESENILDATIRHLLNPVGPPQKWFIISFLQKLHYDMFCDVWEWAGKFRTHQTIPGIKPFQIPESLANLSYNVLLWCNEPCQLTRVEQAARIHHQLVFIHPYPNGNGRFSRMVSDRYLKAWKCPFPTWPVDLNRAGTLRKKYIAALRAADDGDYIPLTQYMVEHGARDQ